MTAPGMEEPEAALSFEESVRIVLGIEAAFRTLNLDLILECFLEDAVVRFPFVPPICGRPAIRSLLAARYADYSHYSLDKEVIAARGSRIAVKLRAQWLDLQSTTWQCSEGLEVLTIRNDRIAQWEAVFAKQAMPAPRL